MVHCQTISNQRCRCERTRWQLQHQIWCWDDWVLRILEDNPTFTQHQIHEDLKIALHKNPVYASTQQLWIAFHQKWIDSARSYSPRYHLYRRIRIQPLVKADSWWRKARRGWCGCGEQCSTPCPSRQISEGDDRTPLRRVHHPSFSFRQSIVFRQFTCRKTSWWVFWAPNNTLLWPLAYWPFLNIYE